MSDWIPDSKRGTSTLLDIMKDLKLIDEIQNGRLSKPKRITDPLEPITHTPC